MSEDQVRGVIAQYGKLPGGASSIAATADLYQAGLTSHASVNVMLALEDEFDIEFPDSMLKKATFASIAAINEAVEQIQSES
ncbi:MAG: acyl carrier protein [Candidatus Nanopelagicales bacterium]